jgi:hypothetical protein
MLYTPAVAFSALKKRFFRLKALCDISEITLAHAIDSARTGL